MDNKAKIPVGEPGTPEPATSHMRKAVTTKNVTLEASDHNYHVTNLTPSVDLICDIPDTPFGSFYSGQVYVGLKDSIFEGSDPLRHVTELMSVLKRENERFSPYLVLFTDGGADHNLTFLYVQCVLLALFKIGDFDILNVGRCAPYQSYINPAERVMSVLNIGLQGLALDRDHAGVFENVLSSCKTMNSVRSKADQHVGLKEYYLKSIAKPRRIIESTFSELELKGIPFKVFEQLRDEKEVVDVLHKIEPLITSDSTMPRRRTSLKSYPCLEKYLEVHLNEGLYMLQFRKCNDHTCCILRSEKLPPPVPAPVMSPDGQHYLSFETLYGKVDTTEKDCPSLQVKSDKKKAATAKDHKFLSRRVVGVLECSLCGKPRCLFSMNGSLNVKGQQEIETIFSCGMSLSTNSLYTARHISCSSAIENAYLSSAFRKRLEDGVTNQSFTNNEAANGQSSAVNFVVEIKGTPPPEKQKYQLKLTSWAKANEGSTTKSVNLKRKGNDDLCRICGADEPPGKTKIIEWVDCDICHAWGHSTCAKNEESNWKNIRRKSWLCNVHNV